MIKLIFTNTASNSSICFEFNGAIGRFGNAGWSLATLICILLSLGQILLFKVDELWFILADWQRGIGRVDAHLHAVQRWIISIGYVHSIGC